MHRKKQLNKYFIAIASVVVLAVALQVSGLLGTGSFSIREPKLTVKVVKTINGKEVPQEKIRVNMYAVTDGLVKTFINTTKNGKAFFEGLGYDRYYFVAEGSDTNYGGIYSSPTKCGREITFNLENGRIYQYVDGVKGEAMKEYTLYPTKEYIQKCEELPSKNTAPAAPNLVWPGNGRTDVELDVVLQWSKPESQGKSNYKWMITDSSGKVVWDRGWRVNDILAEEKEKNCKSIVSDPMAWTCEWVKVPEGILKPGQTYTWKVQAGDGEFSSNWSQESTFTTKTELLVLTPPVLPESFFVLKKPAVGNESVELNWDYMLDDNAITYFIWRTEDITLPNSYAKKIGNSKKKKFIDSTVEAGKTYYYFVEAYKNGSGTVGMSNIVSVKAVTIGGIKPETPKTDLGVDLFEVNLKDNKIKIIVKFINPDSVAAERELYIKGKKVKVTPETDFFYANYEAKQNSICSNPQEYVELKAYIDPANTVKETNESNNEKTYVFYCGNPSRGQIF